MNAEYEALCAKRTAQRCCDCGKDEGYTTLNRGREVVCRTCYTDRANNPDNPNFAKLAP